MKSLNNCMSSRLCWRYGPKPSPITAFLGNSGTYSGCALGATSGLCFTKLLILAQSALNFSTSTCRRLSHAMKKMSGQQPPQFQSTANSRWTKTQSPNTTETKIPSMPLVNLTTSSSKLSMLLSAVLKLLLMVKCSAPQKTALKKLTQKAHKRYSSATVKEGFFGNSLPIDALYAAIVRASVMMMLMRSAMFWGDSAKAKALSKDSKKTTTPQLQIKYVS
mmetsp:Transcript_10077/g.28144  ORF Transcript_10077/g.28144 Transcript_10077/m.28144 type:complete len:220 (-) Transcript_10077:12-671(-)